MANFWVCDAEQRVLCVLLHGMAGSQGDFQTWVDCLSRRCPQWIVKPLMSLEAHVTPIIGKGLDSCAALVAQEIISAVRDEEEAATASGVTMLLHCVGHSMGGLILRGALPKVFQNCPNLQGGVFLSLSTPHLGVKASLGAPEGMWRNLSRLTAFLSPQCPQLAIQDRTAENGQPHLLDLARPGGSHLAALGQFRRRMCVTMSYGDPVVPTASGALWVDRTWSKPELPSHCVAGWGLEAYSVTPEVSRSPDGCVSDSSSSSGAARCDSSSGASADRRRRRRRNNLQWAVSEDGACSFPTEVLEGLQCVCWERIVFRLLMPKSGAHIFLIGKDVDQSTDLERLYSRQCVEQLVSMLVHGSDSVLEGTELPRWIQTLEVSAQSRDKCWGKWTVATEEGTNLVNFYPFNSRVEADYYFDLCLTTSRVLYDPAQTEIRHAGANKGAFSTIRRHFGSPLYQARMDGRWMVAAEEGPGRVRLYDFALEAEAREAFDARKAVSRILFDPDGAEVASAGWNLPALSTIRHVTRREIYG